MVSVSDIKDYLVLPDTEENNTFIQNLIDRTEAQIKAYCNNNFEEGLPISVEDILIQWVCLKFDTNTRLKVGKSSQSLGQLAVNYTEGIPKEFKSILNLYRKVKML